MAKVSMGIREFESLIKEFIGLENLNLSKDVVEFDLCFDFQLIKSHFNIEINLEWPGLGELLDHHGLDRKIDLIKLIRKNTGLGLAEANCVVDSTGEEILSRWRKYKVTKTLQDMGK